MNAPLTTPSSPPVIFVHGVSLDPRLFTPTALHLRHTSTTWTRPGYDGTPPADSFGEQVARLLEHLAQIGPCIVAGVSGGATLALAAAIARPVEMLGLITHEPLIGPLAPDLHERIANAATSLAGDGSDTAIDAFLTRLYGDTWTTRPHDSVQWSNRHRRLVPTDVEQFASFAPTLSEIAAMKAVHITTVGAQSNADRHRVAVTLQSTGADATVMSHGGHLVVVDNPVGFASAVDEVAMLLNNRSAAS